MEYAVILLLLKKRRKPRRTIDEGKHNTFYWHFNHFILPDLFCTIRPFCIIEQSKRDGKV
jgi:hypothetical protein